MSFLASMSIFFVGPICLSSDLPLLGLHRQDSSTAGKVAFHRDQNHLKLSAVSLDSCPAIKDA